MKIVEGMSPMMRHYLHPQAHPGQVGVDGERQNQQRRPGGGGAEVPFAQHQIQRPKDEKVAGKRRVHRVAGQERHREQEKERPRELDGKALGEAPREQKAEAPLKHETDQTPQPEVLEGLRPRAPEEFHDERRERYAVDYGDARRVGIAQTVE